MKKVYEIIIFILFIATLSIGIYFSAKIGLKTCLKKGGTIESCLNITPTEE
jgi:hypothetical protein